jgi:hypothetical protein
MKTYYKFYFNTYLDGRDDTPAFIIITDGEKYGIAFPDGADEDTVESMSAAIGARIEAATRDSKSVNPTDVLNFISYNMMFLDASEEEDIYPSWEEATNYAKQSLSAFSNGMTGWKFKLNEPVFPDFLNNDNMTEENK